MTKGQKPGTTGHASKARGLTENLVRESLAEYRADPAGHKEAKRMWAVAGELGPLTNPRHVARYRELTAAVDTLLQKMTQGRRQFNSLLELDHHLVSSLGRARGDWRKD